MNKTYLIKTTLPGVCLGLLLSATHSAHAELWNGGTGKFEDPTAWASGAVPASSAAVSFQISADGAHCTADADTWAYLTANGLLNNSTTYRGVNRALFGNANGARTMSFTLDIGDSNTFQLTSNASGFIAERADNVFTVNIISGSFETGKYVTIAPNATSTGTLNVSGGEFRIGRESLNIGNANGGTALVTMSGGNLRTRAGLTIGVNGTLEILGSAPGEIGIGSHSSGDGFATINGTIRAMVDGGGLTPIFVDDYLDDGGATATFNLGSELDVSFLNSPRSGTWTVLELENADIVDNGIAFAAGVDTDVWSFAIDNTGDNGLLTVTAANVPQLTWDGNLSDDWDIATTANWQGGNTYSEPSEVIFDDTLAGSGTVNLTTTFNEVSVNVDNATTNYTFSGTGLLSGIAGVTKNGAGALTLSNTGVSDFTGPVNLNDGTLTLGNATAFGGTDAALNVTGGTLDLGGFSVTKGRLNITGGTINNGSLTTSSVTMTGGTINNGTLTSSSVTMTDGTISVLSMTDGSLTISGGTIDGGLLTDSPVVAEAGTINAVLAGTTSTSLTKNEAGTLSLNGDNAAFEGDINVNAGILKIGHANALGTPGETETIIEDGLETIEIVKVCTTYLVAPLDEFDVENIDDLEIGDNISGPGIPEGSVVVALNEPTEAYPKYTVTMSMDANDANTDVDITFSREEPTTITTIIKTGYTTVPIGATLDLNGQTIAERFLSIGTFINSDITTTAEVSEELKGNYGNPTFDGPGDMIFDDIFKEGTGTRRMTKNGTGTLTLGGDEGNNRYGLTVNEGNVNFSKTSGNVVGRFPLIMNAGTGTVTLLNSNQIHEVNDANGIHEINAGTLDLNGFDEVIGSLSTTAGETAGVVTNSNASDPSNLTLNGTQTSAIPNDVTFPGTISGNLNLIKGADQANTQTLSGVLSYTGNTTVNLGTLEISNAASDLNDASVVSITDGILNLSNGVTDVVDQLWIDGVQQASGTYGSSSSAAGTTDDTHFAGTGMLSVTSDPAADDYGDWATENGLVGGPTDDDDNDGASNETEYAFATDPTDGSSLSAYTAVDPGTASFSYTRRNVALSGLTYDYKFSIDLVDFTIGDAYTPAESSDGGSPIETVTVTIPVELLGEKLFLKIEAN